MTVDRFEIVLPDQPVESLDGLPAAGGGQGLTRARELGPEATIRGAATGRSYTFERPVVNSSAAAYPSSGPG
jgi:hypothetical protein